MASSIRAILFDFGGVIAEEGFREGLKAIADRNRLNRDDFFRFADELISETGYLTGQAEESTFWQALRDRTGIGQPDADLRDEILKRFVMRPPMLSLVDRLRSRNFMTVLLSDQTNWLEQIDRETGLYGHFDKVFNSIRIGMSKRDVSTFTRVVELLGMPATACVFIDDNKGHVDRAAAAGLAAIHFVSIEQCEQEIHRLTGTT